VVQRHLARFDEGITSELADAYDATAVIEQPFLPGNERRLPGRDAIRRHFTAAESAPLQLQIRNLVVHETHDPEVVIAEYDYDGRVTSTGRTFRVANIQVFRIRNGLIVASRDYHDHARIANALRNQLA
jgi:ketosteroid isomerase-like protein